MPDYLNVKIDEAMLQKKFISVTNQGNIVKFLPIPKVSIRMPKPAPVSKMMNNQANSQKSTSSTL